MNWDDLRIIAAIADHGSYAAAGASLRLDETTVARRLARIQADLGVTLFDAVDGRRRANGLCQAMLARVRDMERQAAEITRMAETAPAVGGHVRLATTDSIAQDILAPGLSDVLRRFPGLTLELMTSSSNVAFDRWEADMAIRLRRPRRGAFVMAKLADLALYLVRPALGAEVLACAYPDDLAETPEARTLAAMGLAHPPRCVTANIHVIRTLLASGQWTGILPDFLAAGLEADGALRVEALEVRREAWLLIQPHLKNDATTAAVAAWVRQCFAARPRVAAG